jgi:uncharacterized protein (DUF433 family)
MPRAIAPRIVVDASIRLGKPVIEGTRVPVDILLVRLAQGMTFDEIAEEYGVTVDDIRAALSYAASVLAADEIREIA